MTEVFISAQARADVNFMHSKKMKIVQKERGPITALNRNSK